MVGLDAHESVGARYLTGVYVTSMVCGAGSSAHDRLCIGVFRNVQKAVACLHRATPPYPASSLPPPTPLPCCAGSTFAAEQASIVGNTCLYGATGGSLFVGGRAGERFAVSKSFGRYGVAELVVSAASHTAALLSCLSTQQAVTPLACLPTSPCCLPFRCATRVRRPWWRAPATTAAST